MLRKTLPNFQNERRWYAVVYPQFKSRCSKAIQCRLAKAPMQKQIQYVYRTHAASETETDISVHAWKITYAHQSSHSSVKHMKIIHHTPVGYSQYTTVC